MRGSAALRMAVAPGGALAGPWVRNELWRRAKAVPSLDLNFAQNRSLVDATTGLNLVTFSRTSDATFVGSNGLIQTASAGTPRFDHNPVTGESLGLLVEEQRSNLCLHNRTLTDAAWVKTNITAAKDQVGVTGGSNTASKITATAANGTILQTITSASAARATSAYVKRITGTGTVEMTQDNGSTWTAVTVTNDWTRVTIPSATVTNPVVGFRLVTDADAIAVDFVQLETGAFSTSAIETTTAAATRSADVASISGSNFSSWFNASQFTFYADILRGYSGNFPAFPNIASLNDGTAANNIFLYGTQGNQNLTNFGISSGGVTQNDFVTRPSNFPGPNLIAQALTINSSMFAMNGALTTEDTSITMPVGINQLRIGSDRNGLAQWGGHIRRITYWPQRLPNSTLQSITQ